MSARCPQCDATIDHDYGVVSCPNCASVLFIDMDGNVQLSQSPTGDSGAVSDFSQPAEYSPVSENLPEDPNMYSSQPAPTLSVDEEPPKDMLTEIKEFAEQPSSDTALTYTVIIECIDHAELREQVRDILSDPQFHWNVSEIMKQQKMGRIEIRKINAIKAALVVRRLKSLPLKISWRQYAYT